VGVFYLSLPKEANEMKAIAKESDRRGRSNLRAYLPIATKQRLVAAAELNGLTLTGLIEAVAENAHRILPLLRLDGGDAQMPMHNRASEVSPDSSAVAV
jgi:hypothetical protein